MNRKDPAGDVMFKKILVPLDQSSLAEQALGPAQAIAQASGGEIGLVLAHRLAPYDGSLAPSWSEARDPEEAVYIRRIADEVARGARLVVGGTVATGKPVDAICRRAHEIGADLIVMTSHGRTGFSRAWLGSVADGVIRNVSTPVLMLRAVDDTKALGHGHAMPLFHRILVPLDGSSTSSAVLPAAAAMARCSGATLVLLRVVAPVPIYIVDPQVPAYPTSIPDPEATKQAADEAEEALASLAANVEHEYSVKAQTVVEIAPDAARTILAVAKAREADLIAMTTHGRGASRVVLGSVADKVLRGAHLPMLLYHPTAPGVAAPAHATSQAARQMAGLTEAELTP
jgi:nucleotide-binding universal stress UspA family protein